MGKQKKEPIAYEVVITATATVYVDCASSSEEAEKYAREQFTASEWSSIESTAEPIHDQVEADRSKRHSDHRVTE